MKKIEAGCRMGQIGLSSLTLVRLGQVFKIDQALKMVHNWAGFRNE